MFGQTIIIVRLNCDHNSTGKSANFSQMSLKVPKNVFAKGKNMKNDRYFSVDSIFMRGTTLNKTIEPIASSDTADIIAPFNIL